MPEDSNGVTGHRHAPSLNKATTPSNVSAASGAAGIAHRQHTSPGRDACATTNAGLDREGVAGLANRQPGVFAGQAACR